jgi:hypothetical protein
MVTVCVCVYIGKGTNKINFGCTLLGPWHIMRKKKKLHLTELIQMDGSGGQSNILASA